MIEVSSLGLAATLILLTSVSATVLVDRFYVGSSSFLNPAWKWWLGIATAPYLLGLAGIAALTILPGSNQSIHLAVILTILGIPIFYVRSFISRQIAYLREDRRSTEALSFSFDERLIMALIAAVATALCVDALVMPTVQNDALEYLMVGRHLFESRTLASYPILDGEIANSGFYAPWTHPPLFVAMIYVFNLVQGTADAPGVAKLVAPWFLLSSSGLIYVFGRMRNRRTGLLAALFVLSTPLLYMGAGSGLIDALPVSGAAMVLVALVFFLKSSSENEKLSAMVLGIALGLSLWTHSQAVLLLVLVGLIVVLSEVLKGRTPFSGTLMLRLLIVFFVAGILAVWPYAKNVRLFSSPISDNPLVFAMPELNWAEYFRMTRGIETLREKIQYGFFKGWFFPEAYSFIFWLMLPGLGFVLYHLVRNPRGSGGRATWESIVWVAGLTIATYMAIVAVSIVIGIDLMIKNERYLLILIPSCAVLAAWVLDAAGGIAQRRQSANVWLRCLAGIFLLGTTLAFTYQSYTVLTHKSRTFQVGFSNWSSSIDEKLRYWPPFHAMRFLAESELIPQNALVLSMKPADMYYSKHKMVSYLDPRLLEFYREKSDAAALKMLEAIGITHVHVPDYDIPPMYNSRLRKILASVEKADLLHSAGGHQIYRLKPSAEENSPSLSRHAELGFDQVPWTISYVSFVLGRSSIFSRSSPSQPYSVSGPSQPGLEPMFGELHTVLVSGTDGEIKGDTSVEAETEYLLELNMHGKPHVSVYLYQVNKDGKVLYPFELNSMRDRVSLGWKHRVTDGPLSLSEGREFSHRFRTLPDVGLIRIAISYRGTERISLERANVFRVGH